MIDDIQRAMQSVIDVHVLIENVFNGRQSEQCLVQLLQHFDSQFSMVTLSGNVFQYAQVQSLFATAAGKKPDLKITVSDIRLILHSANYCLLQYQELQQNAAITTLRRSTVCIRVAEQQCFWQYLHETAVTP